jgi:hypothetical protein
MLGKILQRSRGDLYDAMLALSTKKTYDLSATMREPKGTAAGLPQAPANPYRKRPMKLVYDKAEYYSFRLPSENHFLLSSFDQEDLFGKRKGIEHSPHIRAQLNLDSNLVFLYVLFTFIALGLEMKYHDEFRALRDNLVNHDMGKFSHDDFR